MNEIATVSPFEALGADLRFGVTEDGTPFVVGADFARVLDYRDTDKAARLLDADEKGTQIVGTPGGPQRMVVFYEDGIWELVFLSRKPEAKAIKKRVKEILAEIRRTGKYDAAEAPAHRLPQNYAEALRELAAKVEDNERLTGQVAELAPAAESWNTLATAAGDLAVADAAKLLSRDPAIKIGRDRLFTVLRDLRWVYRQGIDQRHRAYQSAIDAGRLMELPSSHYHPRTGELVLDPPQVRVTVKGLEWLHQHLRASQDVVVRGGAA